MSVSRLEEDAVQTTYEDVHPLIRKLSNRYARRYGSGVDWFEEANLIFMRVYQEHEENRSKFSSHVFYKVNIGLLEIVRSRAMRGRIAKQIPLEGDEMNTSAENYLNHTPSGFYLFEFLDGLSDDAKEVVMMVFNSPIDLEMAVKQRGRPTPTRIRSAITEVLQDFGWSLLRVTESFAEIGRALKNG